MSTDINVVAPASIISPRSSAILVAIEFNTTTGERRSRREGEELASRKRASSDAVKVSKMLYAGCPEHRALMNMRGTINNGMKVFTFPWSAGLDMLPMSRYDKFMSWYEGSIVQPIGHLKAEFLRAYPGLRADAAFNMGDMFDPTEFPSIDEMSKYFNVRMYTQEIPAGDYRELMAQEAAADLHKHYARQTNELISRVVDSQIESFIDVMESIRHACDVTAKTNDDGTTKIVRNKLHKATIEKALEMCDTFRQFNPAGDARLETARFGLEKVLRSCSVEQLKSSDTLRAQVGGEVTSILSTFRRPV